MYRLPHILFVALYLFLAPAVIAGAQEFGLYNSLKGIGASVRLPEKDGIFHTVNAYVDIYGVATSRCSYPGYKMNVSRQYVCRRFQRDGYSVAFYAGPGISLGYVRDHARATLLSSMPKNMAGRRKPVSTCAETSLREVTRPPALVSTTTAFSRPYTRN